MDPPQCANDVARFSLRGTEPMAWRSFVSPLQGAHAGSSPGQAPLATRRQPLADPAPHFAGGYCLVRAHVDSRCARQVRDHPHPVVVHDVQHRRRERDPVRDDGGGRDRTCADLFGRAPGALDGRDAVRAASPLSLPSGLGDPGNDWLVHGDILSTSCLCFLVTHQNGDSRLVPQVSLITSWILVVGSFGFLVYYSHRIATSIQNPDMIARVVDDLYPAVVGSHSVPSARGGALPDDDAILRSADAGAPVLCPKSGYMQHLDHGALVAAARAAGALRRTPIPPRSVRVARGTTGLDCASFRRGPTGSGRRSLRLDRAASHADTGQRVRNCADCRNRDSRAQPCGQRHIHGGRVRRLACRRSARPRREAARRRQLVRQLWRASRVDPGRTHRAARETRVRPDPPGIGDDAGGAHPPARCDPPSGTANVGSCATRPCGAGRRDPRDGNRARRAGPPRPRSRVRERLAVGREKARRKPSKASEMAST